MILCMYCVEAALSFESRDHLFIACPFVKTIWNCIIDLLHQIIVGLCKMEKKKKNHKGNT